MDVKFIPSTFLLLNWLKEKKLGVVTNLRECVDAIYPLLGIETIQGTKYSITFIFISHLHQKKFERESTFHKIK